MVLTPSNLVHLLIERGFVTPDSVVDGRYLACESSRRQRSYKVMRRGLPGYFVKQVKRWDADRCSAIEREAYCYWLARNDPEFAALARILPHCYAFDPDLYLLISEFLDGADLRRLYQHSICPELDVLLGETLASYQRELRGPMVNRLHDEFRGAIPGAFTMHRRDEASLMEPSDGNRELLRLIAAEKEMGAAIDRMGELWRAETLIHGDMKWANCLMVGGNDPCLKIVDWEMADFGDGLWDAGALLQEYFLGGLAIGSWGLGRSLADMRLGARRFWESYVGQSHALPVGSKPDLAKAFGFGAVRMLQSAWENLQFSDSLTPASVQMVQAAANILDDPARAAREFLDGA